MFAYPPKIPRAPEDSQSFCWLPFLQLSQFPQTRKNVSCKCFHFAFSLLFPECFRTQFPSHLTSLFPSLSSFLAQTLPPSPIQGFRHFLMENSVYWLCSVMLTLRFITFINGDNFTGYTDSPNCSFTTECVFVTTHPPFLQKQGMQTRVFLLLSAVGTESRPGTPYTFQTEHDWVCWNPQNKPILP